MELARGMRDAHGMLLIGRRLTGGMWKPPEFYFAAAMETVGGRLRNVTHQPFR